MKTEDGICLKLVKKSTKMDDNKTYIKHRIQFFFTLYYQYENKKIMLHIIDNARY